MRDLNKIHNFFLVLGNGLLSKWKYDFYFKYDAYEFFKARFLNKRLTNKKIYKNIK